MRVFYYCYGSAHSSVVAAAIHLGLLPSDRIPTSAEIINLPRFDRTKNHEIGTPFYMGEDEHGNEIYILGLGPDRDIISKAIYSLLTLLGYPLNCILLIDALAPVHPVTRLGGFLSRRLGWVRVGRPLVTMGVKWRYRELLFIVNTTKGKIKSTSSPGKEKLTGLP